MFPETPNSFLCKRNSSARQASKKQIKLNIGFLEHPPPPYLLERLVNPKRDWMQLPYFLFYKGPVA